MIRGINIRTKVFYSFIDNVKNYSDQFYSSIINIDYSLYMP